MADKEPDAAKGKNSGSAEATGGTGAGETAKQAPGTAAAVQEPADECCGEKSAPCCDESHEHEDDADSLHEQRISGILKAVLDEVPPPVESSGKRFRYPWYMDAVMAAGLLLAVGGFTIGLFKMYITHKAQVCIREQNYQAAIALLKGNPLPPLFNTMGEEDPEELLARALYLDAMKKMDEGDTRGGLAELQQIRAGTQEFEHAQKILSDNFEPSSTQLTGGVVQNEANAANK